MRQARKGYWRLMFNKRKNTDRWNGDANFTKERISSFAKIQRKRTASQDSFVIKADLLHTKDMNAISL